MPDIHPDNKYIEALLTDDPILLEEIYRRFSPRILSMVLQNNGTADDAADLFQDAIVDLYKKASTGFVLSCPMEAFLYRICRNRWLNTLSRKKYNNVTFADDEGYSNLVSDESFANAEEIVQSQNRKNLVESKLAELGDGCRRLLEFSWGGKKLEEVARLMNTSYQYIRKKKGDCLGKLVDLIRKSPDYRMLLN